jgi:diacylglycerol kinase (ATP)
LTALTLVHNRRAGIQRIAAPALIHLIQRAGYDCHYVPRRLTADLAADLARWTPLIAVTGGDGTVGEVLRKGRRLPLNLAIVPSGVANNIARSVGISHRLPEAVAAWRRSRLHPVHLATTTFNGKTRLVVESIGIGALAGATRKMEGRCTTSFARHGKLDETRRCFRDVIATAPPLRRLTINGERIGGRPIFVEILNIPFTGPNLCLVPQASISDGHLHLVYTTEAHRQAIVDWLSAGARAAERPGLPTRRARSFTIAWTGASLRIDDTLPDVAEERLTVSSVATRMCLLVP